MIGFSESIRSELKLVGHDHVRVTIVCPSYIGTGMFEGAKPPKTTHILEPDFVAEKVLKTFQGGYLVERLDLRAAASTGVLAVRVRTDDGQGPDSVPSER